MKEELVREVIKKIRERDWEVDDMWKHEEVSSIEYIELIVEIEQAFSVELPETFLSFNKNCLFEELFEKLKSFFENYKEEDSKLKISFL